MSDITEKEALSRFIEGLRQAEGASRIIAHYRSDEHWARIAHNIGMIITKSSEYALQADGRPYAR